MAEEFHTGGGGGGGGCSTMSSCWWSTANRAALDLVAPQPSLCSIRDLSRIDQLMIDGNQPCSFLPMIDQDSVQYSSLNPLEEAFLPGFFEPPAAAEEEPIVKKALHYRDHDSLLHSTSSSRAYYKFMNIPPPHHFFQLPNYSIIPKQQQQQQQQQVSNLCNNTSTSPDQLWEPNCANFTPTPTQISVDPKQCSMTKEEHIGSEPPAKKPRIAMLSALPTFKVRKEKLGDRVTALQQLVSPFGKTDTASVLHEAIEYIKFLHDQVGVLTSPYLENGHDHMHTQSLDRPKKNNGCSTDEEDIMSRDLRSRGLCLVPISSTFEFASEYPMDFWAPNYGGSYI